MSLLELAVLKPGMAKVAAKILSIIRVALQFQPPPDLKAWEIVWSAVSTAAKLQTYMLRFLRAIAKLARIGIAAAFEEQTLELAEFCNDCNAPDSNRGKCFFEEIKKLPMRAIDPLAPLLIIGINAPNVYGWALSAFLRMSPGALAQTLSRFTKRKRLGARMRSAPPFV
jgi:hypothetical protein